MPKTRNSVTRQPAMQRQPAHSPAPRALAAHGDDGEVNVTHGVEVTVDSFRTDDFATVRISEGTDPADTGGAPAGTLFLEIAARSINHVGDTSDPKGVYFEIQPSGIVAMAHALNRAIEEAGRRGILEVQPDAA